MAAMEGYSNVGNSKGINFDDMDLEGGNVIDEWHEGDPEHKKEDFAETENIRYLLKNCNVPLDNGSHGLVFSADYTQRGPIYTCHVCGAKMHGVKEFNMHANSQNHCSAMERNKHPAKNFPALFEDLDTQIELGEPAPPGMENEIQIKPCKIQASLDSFRMVPLIGLEYLIELTDGRDAKAYNCLLCDKQGISSNILKHFTSVKHSLNYLSKYFPRVFRAFGSLPKSPEYRRGSSIILTRIIKRIEGKFGRLKPRPYVYHHFASGKEALLKSIQEEFHFKESPDDEFDKMIKPDEILALQFSNNQPEAKEKVEEKITPDPVVASNTKSSLFKTTKINVPKEKLRTERDESPDCEILEDKKEDNNIKKDDRKLDNLSPVSGGSIGSMRRSRSRSRSRSNSRPRGSYRGDRRRSRSPAYRNRNWNHKQSRSPNPRHRSRSRNRTRSPVRSRSPLLPSRSRQRSRSRHRSRSGDRSRTANRSRSGNRSRSPQQQFRPRYMRVHESRSRSRSRDRLNLPYRRKRSYSRSRSRSPRSFNRARNYKPPPKKSPDEEQVKSDKFKEELRVLLDKLKYHEKFPEKHPQYPVEWKEFWNKRYKELQAAGKDPSKHDFKPEWISYWKKRMLELHDQEAVALKERIYNPVKEKKPEEDVTVSDIKNTWKALTGSEILDPNLDVSKKNSSKTTKGPPGTRMGFVPFTDDSTKVISVLRLITVLESMLGVLAPKIVTLLSKALSMDKVKAGSSEDILYNEEDCVLLEIVKEKLKGLFFAGLVERHLVNTTKYTIKNIEELLSKAPRSFGKRTDPLPTPVKPSIPVIAPAPPPPAPPKQVTVPGIGTVDRMAIAEQIATALISQGRTDVSEQELESLIDAVVASTSEEQSAPPSTSQSQSQTQASGALTLLQSAYDEEDADIDRGDPHILSKTLPLIESVDIITNLSDYDLRTLVEHFNRLQPVNQTKVINYLRAVEKTAPSRFQKLQGTTPVNLNKLILQAKRHSPFSSRRDNSNPGGSNAKVVTIDDDDDDDDDYTFEDIYRAASQKIMKANNDTRPSQPPPPPYTNSAWWPSQ
ncbi:hypothetical protein LSTR_LSTR005594 [Laodelphax striatellus]|uniref:C2H2-type domain-containing protein n=1 Tax=Laodelphax striatellus TaxID=195883 RepID=A0A482WXL7_LAOST|nr:hypothetical protein LSTR_LSTR005594 [Laodelphax striatellus]